MVSIIIAFIRLTAMVCDVLTDPLNGTVIGDNRTFTSVVRYECIDGYFLVGDETRTCQADGEWSGDDPTCMGK